MVTDQVLDGDLRAVLQFIAGVCLRPRNFCEFGHVDIIKIRPTMRQVEPEEFVLAVPDVDLLSYHVELIASVLADEVGGFRQRVIEL